MWRTAGVVLVAGALAGCGTTLQRGGQQGGGLSGSGGAVGTGQFGTGQSGTATTSATANGAAAGVVGGGPAAGGAGAGGTSQSFLTTTAAGSDVGGGGTTGVGVGRAAGPVVVGFLNTKTSNAAAFGLNVGQTYTNRDIFTGLVKAMNAKGGIAGRQIVPVVADTDTASASWASDYQAACATFTQDNKVATVIGYSFAFIQSFEACLAKAGVPHIDGGYAVGDIASFQQYPYLVATTSLTVDRRYAIQLEGGMRGGYLSPSSRLGLLLDDCPEDARAYERTVKPYLQAHHLQVAATSTLSCVGGATDDSNAVAQIQAAELHFRSSGVDHVFIEGIPLIIFAQEAESQGWRPVYLVTSASGGAALEGNAPAAQAANVHGAGWIPDVDVDPVHQPPRTPAQQRCLALLKSQGIVPSQYNDFHSAFTTCDGLFLYERALQATQGVSRAAAVVRAIGSLGSQYQGVSVVEGSTMFSPSRRDAPARYRHWGWNGPCSCFVYQDASQPLP